ncbi:hypothetical protein TcCL_ESM11146, partial [Trypanosoma cruzi]
SVCAGGARLSLPHSHAATTAAAAAHATRRRSKRGEVVWETAVLPSLSSVAAVLFRLGSLAATFFFRLALLSLWLLLVFLLPYPLHFHFLALCSLPHCGHCPLRRFAFRQNFHLLLLLLNIPLLLVPLFCCVPPFPRQVFLDLILLQRLSVLFLHLLAASFFPGFLFLFRLHLLRYLILLLNSLPVMVLLLLAFAFCRRLLFPQCRHHSFSQYFEDP